MTRNSWTLTPRDLHEKLDHLTSRQWQRLTEIQQIQLDMLQDLSRERRQH
jgi:hypothetical protein